MAADLKLRAQRVPRAKKERPRSLLQLRDLVGDRKPAMTVGSRLQFCHMGRARGKRGPPAPRLVSQSSRLNGPPQIVPS
jgi:hypothetical protein